MPRIDRIRIHNFRGASAPFTLGFAKQKPLVVIFGENGTGKTTIVDALDAIGNGSGGSLTTKSSTTLRTHLPTLGKKPSDMVMEVTSGNTTWTATLGKGGIVTSPTPRPPIQVLRRTNLQRFIDSPPGQRYAELRHLIGVDRVEKSEEALKRALDGAKQQFEDAVRDLSSAEDQLANIWQAEGRPGSDWRSWASEAARADATHLMQGVERSRRTREAVASALRTKSAWEQAEAALIARHQALAGIEQEVAEGPTLDAAKAMQLVEMLGKVREHLDVGDHEDQCPVCGQDIPLANLQQTIDDRLADLARYEELSRRRRSAQDQLRSAEGVAESARKALERVMDFVEGFSPEWPSLRRNNGVFADDSRRRVAGSGPGTLKRLISGALRASEPSHDSASPPEVHNRLLSPRRGRFGRSRVVHRKDSRLSRFPVRFGLRLPRMQWGWSSSRIDRQS